MAQPKLAASTEFKIEKGVPMPEANSRVAKYPFAAMDVGDSIFVPGKSAANFSATALGWARRHDMTFICRTVAGGVRVWRTA